MKIARIIGCVVLLICLILGMQPGQARAEKSLKGITFGMSPEEVHRWIKKQPGSTDIMFIKTICRIPLGLDFMRGLSVMSSETGIMMYKALGFPPLYFYKDRFIGYRRDLVYLDEFLGLKKQYPSGKYSTYRFAGLDADRTVFQAEENGEYVFTNEMFDLYVFDAAVRKQILSHIEGSDCWLSKLTSPRLPRYVNEYEQCVAKTHLNSRLLREDLDRCHNFCKNQYELFYSPECDSICDEAYVMGKLGG